jgi:hypothetical protein
MSSVQNKVLKIQKVEWAVVQPDRGGGACTFSASKNIEKFPTLVCFRPAIPHASEFLAFSFFIPHAVSLLFPFFFL